MIELAQLFQDVEAAVVQQEPAVEEIETKAGIINDNVGKANTQIDGAIEKARSRNRKKWYCLGALSECLIQIQCDIRIFAEEDDLVILLIIIAVVVAVAVVVTNNNKNK